MLNPITPDPEPTDAELTAYIPIADIRRLPAQPPAFYFWEGWR
jgi:hypothetical protein